MINLRPLTETDIDFVLRQTAREGWDTARHRVEIHLAHDFEGAFIADDDGEPVGMVTTTGYGAGGFIGNLIVVPERRSRGVGRALMEHGLAHLEAAGITTVRLDGDPPGIPLYRSLGFVDEWESRRYDVTARSGRADDVRPMVDADLDEVCVLDQPAFGDDRGRLLRLLASRCEVGLVVENATELAGFLFAERTSRGMRIGPVVAVDASAGRSLIGACLGAVAPCAVTIGVPGVNVAGCRLLDDLGCRATESSLRMVRGRCVAGGDPCRVFAIAGGDVG